jgi:hypothetical protein
MLRLLGEFRAIVTFASLGMWALARIDLYQRRPSPSLHSFRVLSLVVA